jgi:hypothetical protein
VPDFRIIIKKDILRTVRWNDFLVSTLPKYKTGSRNRDISVLNEVKIIISILGHEYNTR